MSAPNPQQSVTVELSGLAINCSSALSVKVGLMYSFSDQHIRASRFLRDQSRTLESSQGCCIKEQLHTQHRAFVTNCVLSAVAGLESSINELFDAAVRKDPHVPPGISDQTLQLLAQLWETEEQAPILNKFQIALTASGKALFQKGQNPYQDADSVVRLRNSLVHYKPELYLDSEDHDSLLNRLKGRFPENALSTPTNTWFPHRCLGSGCCDWAIMTCESFLNEFYQRMGIPSRVPPP